MQMILIILIRKEECSENDHFLNTQILKKYSSFYVLLFDSGPNRNIIISSLSLIKENKSIYIMFISNVLFCYNEIINKKTR